MKIATHLIFPAVLLFLSGSSVADTWHTSKIKRIYPQATETVILTFQTHAPACTGVDKYHQLAVGNNGMTVAGINHILSVALAAAAMDKPVTINFDETS